jgi:hypothetical protein
VGGTPMTNFEPAGAVSILAVDRIDSSTTPKPANVAVRGSIVYTKSTDRMPTTASGGVPGGTITGFEVEGVSSVAVTDVVRVMSPLHSRFNQHIGIALLRRPQNCVTGVSICENPVTNNTATRLTSVRGTKCYGANCGDSFGTNGVSGKANETDWSVTNQSVGNCVTGSTDAPCSGTHTTAVQTPWQNTSTNGARLCYRWGTTTPLWPWPMNERIKRATESAGSYSGPCPTCVGGRAVRTATDVTADIEKLLGTIPASCRAGGQSAPPTPPTFLIAR